MTAPAPITDHDWWFAAGVPVHSLVVEVPMALHLNANMRLHHAPKGQRTAAIRQLAFFAAHGHANGPRMMRAHCLVRIGWPDRRHRDRHNLWPTVKAALDGIITDAGWLPDDNDAHLEGPDLRSFYAGRKGVVVLEFSFLDLSTQESA